MSPRKERLGAPDGAGDDPDATEEASPGVPEEGSV